LKAFACSLAALLIVAPAVHAQDSLRIAPDQVFHFKPNAYGCLSKDKFDAAFEHAQAGERAQMQTFFSGYDCLNTPQASAFRVVQVVGHDVEFVNAANHDHQGMWTADQFIK
jgi:hypothetical protein